jgi:hypothetical protein
MSRPEGICRSCGSGVSRMAFEHKDEHRARMRSLERRVTNVSSTASEKTMPRAQRPRLQRASITSSEHSDDDSFAVLSWPHTITAPIIDDSRTGLRQYVGTSWTDRGPICGPYRAPRGR